MRRMMFAVAVLVGSLAIGGHVSAAPVYRCGQYRSVFIQEGFTESQWRRADAIMWRVSRCDPTKNVGDAYGLMQITVPKNTSALLATGVEFRTACLPTGSPYDLEMTEWAAACTRQIVHLYGWKAFG